MTRLPHRLQRSRRRGARLPAGTLCVSRPRRWGNPWTVEEIVHHLRTCAHFGAPYCDTPLHLAFSRADGCLVARAFYGIAAEVAVRLYGELLMTAARFEPVAFAKWLDPLRGHDLACWCALCEAHAAGKPMGVECEDCAPCHVDPLIVWANR